MGELGGAGWAAVTTTCILEERAPGICRAVPAGSPGNVAPRPPRWPVLCARQPWDKDLSTGIPAPQDSLVLRAFSLAPAQVVKKVKSMQMFHMPVPSAMQGDRLGICVTQFDPKLLERGLVCAPESLHTIHAALISVEKISYFRGPLLTKAKFHITVGHETVMGRLMFFSPDPDSFDREPVLDSFDFSREYLFQEQYLCRESAPAVTESGEADRKGGQAAEGCCPRQQWALVEFEKPVTCPRLCLVIGSRLDADIHANACRLAFHGVLLHGLEDKNYSESSLPRLKVYKLKHKHGLVERVSSSSLASVLTSCAGPVGRARGKVSILERGRLTTGGQCLLKDRPDQPGSWCGQGQAEPSLAALLPEPGPPGPLASLGRMREAAPVRLIQQLRWAPWWWEPGHCRGARPGPSLQGNPLELKDEEEFTCGNEWPPSPGADEPSGPGFRQQAMDDYSVIGRSLFKKETNIQLFVGLEVHLSTGERGVIDSAFGQSGKFKVHVPGERPLLPLGAGRAWCDSPSEAPAGCCAPRAGSAAKARVRPAGPRGPSRPGRASTPV
ncbi:Selenocysteine-specific elongation factor [Galemys pyrenaicus]|uniref:Selenocysteine-specific elongation factor n=1 Tax=Galemys pyrenaicus TaxID=202257 RepID=A0A8J6DQH3_GALPY|nr:Selenocysteine-specific elongation factor [Galemys pyrenaicus]